MTRSPALFPWVGLRRCPFDKTRSVVAHYLTMGAKKGQRKPPATPEPKAGLSSGDISPMRYLRSSSPMDSFQQSAVRWETPVYAALKEASVYTNTSMNFIANQAVANYLASPEVRTQIEAAKSANTSSGLDDVIKKLSGG